jgi:hypothetical protein
MGEAGSVGRKLMFWTYGIAEIFQRWVTDMPDVRYIKLTDIQMQTVWRSIP